ncbi:hypothetical protein ACKAV7_008381 [Fusarium commune]
MKFTASLFAILAATSVLANGVSPASEGDLDVLTSRATQWGKCNGTSCKINGKNHGCTKGKALDRLFDRCADTVVHTDVSVRRWLRGRFPDRPYKAPFELVVRSASESQYRNELKRCLCFWLRVLQLPKYVVPSVIGRGMSMPQSEMLEQLWSDPVWDMLYHTDQPPTSLVRMVEHDEDEEEEWEEEEDGEDGDESDYDDSGKTKDDGQKIYPWPEQESSCSNDELAAENQSPTLPEH